MMRFIRTFLAAGLVSLVAFAAFSGFKSSPAWGADSHSAATHVGTGQTAGSSGDHKAGVGGASGASMRHHCGHKPALPAHRPKRIGGVAVIGGNEVQYTAPSGAAPEEQIQPQPGRFFAVVESPATLYRQQRAYYLQEMSRLSKSAQGMKPGPEKAELARQFIQVKEAWRNAERAFQDATVVPTAARYGQDAARAEEDARAFAENQRLLNSATGLDLTHFLGDSLY